MSSAIRVPARWLRATSSAYHCGGSPRGRLPQHAIQSAAAARVCTASRTSSASAALSSGPAALILVRVESGSTSVMLIRVEPVTGTPAASMPCSPSSRASSAPSGPPIGATATVRWPAAATARETLTPLPPGSTRSAVARRTVPRTSSGSS